ncbi:MAG: SDR family oxidoreductase [Bacilli bacterium]|nr:SDR family oxidoreductase [Bacilli bacterium]
MNLQNKVAIVTGGAMGNGLGIVKTFLKYGANVVIIDCAEILDDVVKEFQNEGMPVKGYLCDIRNRTQLDEIMNEVSLQYGKIDIVVNNAGVAQLGTFDTMSDAIRDFHFDINIKGTWNVTQASLPYMKEGSIINLSSVTGPMVADPGEVAYATTKAAILGFTKALAMELVGKKIRVNAILPGYIMTPMVEGIALDTNETEPNTVIEGIAEGIPMKRLGTIEELGELAAFLASNASSYITGQGIVIDGGSTLPETKSVGV